MSIDFTGVKAITVPEGAVKKITRKSDGVVLWIGVQTISAVPSISGTYTYTGSAITPIWSNYDSNQLTIGGAYSATNAGTYNATFTPKTGYQWSDGTTTAKTVQWTIKKAAGSLSISPTSITFNSSATLSKTITVTRAGDGAISAVSSNTSVATVSVSGNKVTVASAKTNGSATITISVAAGTNHNAPSNKTCSVTASFTFTISYEAEANIAINGSASITASKEVSINSSTGVISHAGSQSGFTGASYYDQWGYRNYPIIKYNGAFYKVLNSGTYFAGTLNVRTNKITAAVV